LITIRLGRPPLRSQRRMLGHYIRRVQPWCHPAVHSFLLSMHGSMFPFSGYLLSAALLYTTARVTVYNAYNVQHHLTTMNQLHYISTRILPCNSIYIYYIYIVKIASNNASRRPVRPVFRYIGTVYVFINNTALHQVRASADLFKNPPSTFCKFFLYR